MKTILNKNKIFTSLIDLQHFEAKKKYRFLIYVLMQEYNNNMILFNTLTRQQIELSIEEYDLVVNNSYSDLIKKLVEDYFLVPIDFEDYKFYQQVFLLAKSLHNGNALKNFIIMPTMDCNARCFYCFEHDAKKISMTNQTAVDVTDYIINKSKGEKIKIEWFGGEPLFNQEAMDLISSGLKEANVAFNSYMITNGYLFDEATVKKAISLWKLKNVQITLDGTRNIYNRTKNFIYDKSIDAFERVMKNIEILAKNEINVCIRLNLDVHNKDDLFALVGQISNRYQKYKNYISVYVWLLYENRGANKKAHETNERHLLTDSLLDLESYIESLGFQLKSIPKQEIKTFSCLADNSYSVTVLPNGNLGKCDHHSDDEIIGSIYSAKLDNAIISSWKELVKPVDLCKDCPIVPECLNLRKCPDGGSYKCDEYLQKQRISRTRMLMRNAIRKSEQK